MSIVCGTDFSEMATHAATAAACLAARIGHRLDLIHALDVWPEELRERPGHPALLCAESRLDQEAERLRALGAEVHADAMAGHADTALQTAAREHSASAIVIGATGHRGHSSRRLGRRADRAETRLSELIPADAPASGIRTRVYALDAGDASDAICQMAERIDADLICLGTHGRSGLARRLLDPSPLAW